MSQAPHSADASFWDAVSGARQPDSRLDIREKDGRKLTADLGLNIGLRLARHNKPNAGPGHLVNDTGCECRIDRFADLIDKGGDGSLFRVGSVVPAGGMPDQVLDNEPGNFASGFADLKRTGEHNDDRIVRFDLLPGERGRLMVKQMRIGCIR